MDHYFDSHSVLLLRRWKQQRLRLWLQRRVLLLIGLLNTSQRKGGASFWGPRFSYGSFRDDKIHRQVMHFVGKAGKQQAIPTQADSNAVAGVQIPVIVSSPIAKAKPE